MKAVLVHISWKNNKELILHSLIGLLTGYFILHPVSMAIYWFEENNIAFSFIQVKKILSESIVHSFSLHMMPMSVAYSVLGVAVGLISGFYYTSIKKKNLLLYGKRQLLQQSIPSLIAEGETEFVEFKSSLRHDYRQVKTDKNLEHVILKSIAGFLNGKGGTLIIGVDDYGEILGLDDDYFSLKKKDKDGFQQRLITIVSTEFGKDICPKLHISFYTIDEKEVCTILVRPSLRPVYFNEGNRTVFFLRTGNVTHPLTTSETVEYLQSKHSH